MAHRSADGDLVRSDGSPLADEDTSEKNIFPVENNDGDGGGEGGSGGDDDGGCELLVDIGEDDADLPQCKIKRNYSCSLCPFFSQNPRSFLYHSRDVHLDRIKIYECSQCLYASKHSQKLQRHINMIHVAGKNRVKKPGKVEKMEKKRELRPIRPKPPDDAVDVDAETDVDSPEVENKQDESEALALDDDSPDEDNLPSGLVAIDGEFRCCFCNFRNKDEQLMRRHEKIVHLKKKFLKCTKCSYMTHVKARFTKHVKYHSMPMIKCDLCDFRTPYKWNLDRHYKNHCGSGSFQCSKCNFRADIKQSLTVHEMNHHVPPVGQGAIVTRRKNKVGASETTALESDSVDKEELELLRLEREDSEPSTNQEVDEIEEVKSEENAILQSVRNVKPTPSSNKRGSTNNNNHLQTDFIHPDDIVPRYGRIFVKELKCKFCSYKAVFSHEIMRHEKKIHGYFRLEMKKDKVPKRPPPKLIPIQNKGSPGGPVSSPILKIPSVRTKSTVPPSDGGAPSDKSVNEIEFNEMCKKSSLTSSLKDIVSLIGDEEGLKTIPDSSRDDLEGECSSWTSEVVDETDAEAKTSEEAMQKQTDLLKKKNASFFDKLKEKLMTSNTEEQSLFCEVCGHESKCLSEAVAHQKRHTTSNNKSDSESNMENDVIFSGTELSSTRCQHCRQRCKTSTDLINHLKSCKAFGASQSNPDEDVDFKIKTENLEDEEEEKEDESESMENRVFVWNDLGQPHGEEEEGEAMDIDLNSNEEFQMVTETAYGTVTSKGSDNTESGTLVMEVDPRLNLTVKKVFKCPHCSFWASTASRFHVHIVGHLNKKPFECSLCLYRSNWRWDITKHIRLKSARDPSHLEAQVNMTDETGRRNYSKYNKYLTMMKVQEPTAESSGTGKRSKPNDVTQGNVTDKDIVSLPAPPRLTRAPTPGTSHQVPQGVPLRPPPPLKAAHQVSPPQTKAQTGSKEGTKKTLWKCKKCNFRHSQKDNVLAHVKEHYGKKSDHVASSTANNGMAINSSGTPFARESSSCDPNNPSRAVVRTPTYKCGHCFQISNWKHVIQRHCRLKHNGHALIQVGYKDENSYQSVNPAEKSEILDNLEDPASLISCDICPFTTDTEGDLTAHKLNHVDRPGSIFKCSYCPFYVPSKIAVLEHMEIHGVNEGCSLSSLKVDNFDPSECNKNFSMQNIGSTGDPNKRYQCRQCPYLSNSRSQFLYHKQFHRPRDAPFKCIYCSYNVSRRHLLHQHLRVHHQKDEVLLPMDENEPTTEPAAGGPNELDTSDLPEIPLVWVLKSGNFRKMFKCRWCPHVNMRKVNIQEHEKMHRGLEVKKNTSNSSSPAFKFQCPDCNYTCSNAGVLASHVKVHQGCFGEIRCLFDPTRPDAEQLQELQNSLQVVEPEVVIEVEAESEPEESQVAATGVEDVPLSSQPENAYNHTNSNSEANAEEGKKTLSFCGKCPARFFFKKELRIHSKFHMIHLPFRCLYCTYTARQRPHLLAHYKIHTQEYQEKTAGLVDCYLVSPEFPRPKTEVIANESQVIEGPVWMVVKPGSVTEKTDKQPKAEEKQNKPVAKHACNRCPATFFKLVALQYHLTLHGGAHQHKCKFCDYTVKTYGNLIKHQIVHENAWKDKTPRRKFSYTVPPNGEEKTVKKKTVQEKTVKEKNVKQKTVKEKTVQVKPGYNFKEHKTESDDALKRTDPQFGTLIHGSPEFIYPTYLKNGRVKEKRYKCHKCPSAFEKREQYRIHLSLHGSKQKYRCEKCDYSVKYYANYVQHKRKHESHEDALKVRRLEMEKARKMLTELEKESSPVAEPQVAVQETEIRQPVYELTLLEQQTLLLQGRKNSMESKEEEKRTFGCKYCPYVNIRRDAVDDHTTRHYNVSGIKSDFECSHCDYMATQGNFLREHNKLHFNKSSRYKAEAYLKCEKMELWCFDEESKDDSKILVFRDRGEDVEDRFYPPLESLDEDDDDDDWKIYVNPESGEPIEEGTEKPAHENFSIVKVETDMQTSEDYSTSYPYDLESEDLIEMVEDPLEEVTEEAVEERVKPKRCRGKNWKCKKCPHAFGKRDQYLRHVTLHGSNQKHNCDICDYSVKFYTNYVQHMRMHQANEPDRIIHVKKNSPNWGDNGSKRKDCEMTEVVEVEMRNEESTTGTPDEESESNPEPEYKLDIDKYDQECSSLSDGTEVSYSSPDDGPCLTIDENMEGSNPSDPLSCPTAFCETSTCESVKN